MVVFPLRDIPGVKPNIDAYDHGKKIVNSFVVVFVNGTNVMFCTNVNRMNMKKYNAELIKFFLNT